MSGASESYPYPNWDPSWDAALVLSQHAYSSASQYGYSPYGTNDMYMDYWTQYAADHNAYNCSLQKGSMEGKKASSSTTQSCSSSGSSKGKRQRSEQEGVKKDGNDAACASNKAKKTKVANVPKPVKRADCSALISKFVLKFMDQLVVTEHGKYGQEPSVEIRLWADTFVAADGTLHQRTKKLRFLKLSKHTLTRFARIMVCLDMLQDMHMAGGRTCTQRELFYRAKGVLFTTQQHMNNALKDVMHLLRVSREELGVFAGERGLVSSKVLTFNALSCDYTPISDALLRKSMGGTPSVALVVEKETVFAHLVGSGMLDMLPIVIVTSKGFPDILTRRLLQWFDITFPQLPVIYIGDFDPHGVLIFLTYLQALPRLGWLGIRSEDVACLPERAALPFSTRDDSILASLQQNRLVTRHPQYLHEVQAMVQLNAKFEVEAMYGTNSTWVKTLVGKIERREWIPSLFA